MKNYSILGIDVGNASCKTSSGIIFDSKITTTEPLIKTNSIDINSKTYYLGEGSFDSTYRKVGKNNYIEMMYGGLALSTNNLYNCIALGLPLSQYKEDKSHLINLVLSNRDKYIKINGDEKHLIIEDVEVFPEAVTTLDDDYEGIVVDIGGRTTDCALIINERGRRKILNPISLPTGTINLYTEFINKLNNEKGLDLQLTDAERIIKNGLLLDGKKVEVDFALEVFKSYVISLISRLQIEYSLRTNYISLTGGGAGVLYKSIKNRVGDGVSLQENSIFANCNSYYELGCSIWR